jgi:hypothetical protein
VRLLGSDGSTTSTFASIESLREARFDLESMSPGTDVSTVVESDQPVVVDRTMSWNRQTAGFGSGYGSHSETASVAPSTTWYLAEGATHGADARHGDRDLLAAVAPRARGQKLRHRRAEPSHDLGGRRGPGPRGDRCLRDSRRRSADPRRTGDVLQHQRAAVRCRARRRRHPGAGHAMVPGRGSGTFSSPTPKRAMPW